MFYCSSRALSAKEGVAVLALTVLQDSEICGASLTDGDERSALDDGNVTGLMTTAGLGLPRIVFESVRIEPIVKPGTVLHDSQPALLCQFCKPVLVKHAFQPLNTSW